MLVTAMKVSKTLASMSALRPFNKWRDETIRLGEERNRLLNQRDTLVSERDDVQLRCKRITGELAASIAREEEVLQERDELQVHCRRLNGELAASLAREEEALKERDGVQMHCRRIAGELAASLAREGEARKERDGLQMHCRRIAGELAASLARDGEALEELDKLLDNCRQLDREIEAVGPPRASIADLLERMQLDWDSRARVNAFHYTNSLRVRWAEDEYFSTGEANVREHILNDMENICQGVPPKEMRVLEIGCGAGRMTRALSALFGEVHAVDVSAEMIRIARVKTGDLPNVFLYRNNGMDLRELPDATLDFVLSFIVFQHIPSKAIIESYVREVQRVLKPGRLFKFQVQGAKLSEAPVTGTWLGAEFTLDEMQQLATGCGFELRYSRNPGTQDFWLWYFRK
jgi:SAM-dependent methyltransferase